MTALGLIQQDISRQTQDNSRQNRTGLVIGMISFACERKSTDRKQRRDQLAPMSEL